MPNVANKLKLEASKSWLLLTASLAKCGIDGTFSMFVDADTAPSRSRPLQGWR